MASCEIPKSFCSFSLKGGLSGLLKLFFSLRRSRVLKTIKSGNEKLKTNANRFNRVLRIKNMAEYEERLVYKSESERALKNCERFLDYVRKELP